MSSPRIEGSPVTSGARQRLFLAGAEVSPAKKAAIEFVASKRPAERLTRNVSNKSARIRSTGPAALTPWTTKRHCRFPGRNGNQENIEPSQPGPFEISKGIDSVLSFDVHDQG
jgi:hypothetical protein